MGTVGYMAPEQVRGEPGDQRSDLFSFGAVLYEMLTGRRAFQRETAAETMTVILREEPAALSSDTGPALPPALDRILSHCLEKKPERRFRSAHDLAFCARGAVRIVEPAGGCGSLHLPVAPAHRARVRALGNRRAAGRNGLLGRGADVTPRRGRRIGRVPPPDVRFLHRDARAFHAGRHDRHL